MSVAVETRKLHPPVDQIEGWIESLCAPMQSRIGLNDYASNSPQQRAVSKARRELEFSTGRRFAESLLKRFGNSDQVWTNSDRSPAWPNGFAGSISHSQNWTWAAVGLLSNIESVGIDTETVVTKETRNLIVFEIAQANEWDQFNSANLTPEEIFSVVFSAKEAFYKCCYPRVKTYFGFEHAAVESASDKVVRIKTLETHPCFDSMPAALDVHYLVAEQDVFTITWMEPCQ